MTETAFNYRICLLEALSTQRAIYRELYVYCMNLVLPNELKDFSELLEEDDEVPGDINILRAMENPVVKTLIPFFGRMDREAETLINVNALTADELRYLEEEAEEDCYITEVEDTCSPDEDFWFNELIIFINYGAYSIFCAAYRLSHEIQELDEKTSDDFYFPSRENETLLNLHDFNVKLLAEFSFSLTELAIYLEENFQ